MEERIASLVEKLRGKADCALVTDDINRRYLTGMKSSAGYVLVFPEETVLIIDSRYIEKARESVRHCRVEELTGGIYAAVKKELTAHGAKTAAVEARSLTVQRLHALEKALPGFSFLADDTLSGALYDLRTVKTPAELERIEAAQQLAEAALDNLLHKLHAGMTEREVALELDFYMRRHGAEDLSFETIALTGAHNSDRKSTRLNSSHNVASRMPSSA